MTTEAAIFTRSKGELIKVLEKRLSIAVRQLAEAQRRRHWRAAQTHRLAALQIEGQLDRIARES